MDTIRSRHRGAFATPWPYAGIALVSVLTSPLLSGASLFLGILVGMVGTLRGAFSKSEPGRLQGVHIFFVGRLPGRTGRIPAPGTQQLELRHFSQLASRAVGLSSGRWHTSYSAARRTTPRTR
jgi:hypothetical protein